MLAKDHKEKCPVCRENATPPEPAAPVVGKLIIDPTPLPFRGSFELDDDAPEPAAPRVTPEDWQRLGEMQDTAREVGERLAEVRERFGLEPDEPDEAEREARAFLGTHYGRGHTTDVQYLATLLRAAEARGRERGLEEMAYECAGASCTACDDTISAKARHLLREARALRSGR